MRRYSRRGTTAVVIAVIVAASTVVGCSQIAQAGGGGQVEGRTLTTDVTLSGLTAYTITVSGSGKASSSPDLANIQLGVESIHADAGEAVGENTRLMQAVMNSIEKFELDERDVQTVNYNMWVETVVDREGNPTGETRYHVSNQVSIRLRDLDRMGEVLEGALAAGANSVGGISFGVSDPSALEREAREKALANAKAKAEQMAAALNVSLGKVRYVGDAGVLPVSSLTFDLGGRGGGGGGEVPIAAGQFEMSMSVQVIFDLDQ
jgi:uncharacterized protein YggE